MEKKYLFLGLAIIILLIGAIIFMAPTQNQEDSRIKVATSFYPLYFFTQNIGGDKIEVINLTPAGAEPHEYELTARDIAFIMESQLLVLNGEGLEPWGERIKQNINPETTIVIEVAEDLATLEWEDDHDDKHEDDHEDEHEDDHEDSEENGHHHEKDPHIWLNPLLAGVMAERITQALISIDPENSDYYQENYEQLKEKLESLDNKFKSELTQCQQRNFVTAHAAFAYMAQAYNLNQISISGLSPEQEPSAAKMAEIAKFVQDNNIKYIFFETLVNPRLSETLAQETGAQTLELNPIEGLSRQEISGGENYFTVMEKNLDNLKTALECQ